MSQLRRMLLSNVGYRSAYYSGVLLNFCNNETKQPENTVIWLANQGGKTTLISLLFTNIEPKQRRFVQHLQKQDHHFSDYFNKTPGVVALELQIGGTDLMGTTAPLVMGQCVVIQDNGQPQRVYFGFTANEHITLDHVPFKGAASDTDPRSMSDFKAWLEAAQDKNSTVFNTANQYDWKKWLDSQGVEHELLAKQIDFCRSEGGISEFASFKNERVFLEQFFRLALDEQISTQAHKTLLNAHKQYKEMPILEERSLIYAELLSGFEGIKPFADQYLQHSKELEEQNARLISLIEQIQLKQQWLDNQLDSIDSKLEKTKEDIEREENRHHETRQHINRTSLTIKALNCKKAEKSLKKEKEKLKEAEKQLVLINAVIAYENLQADKTKADTIQQTISASNKDIEPVKRKLNKIGSQLIATYQYQLDNLRTHLKSVESNLLEIKNTIEQHTNSIKEWKSLLKKEDDTLSKNEQWFESYELQYENLRSNEHLVIVDEEELTVYETETHWVNKTVEQTETIKQLSTEKIEKKSQVEQKNNENLALKKEITILETELIQLEKEKKEALDERTNLEKHPQLCKLIQMDHVNPDDSSLLNKLTQDIEKLGQSISQNKTTTRTLHIQKEWLEKDRFQKPESNIERALEWLEGKGIEANYYPHYLGKQHLSAIEAKALVESDPARFYGIQVNDLSMVRDVIGEFSREELGLSKPITISVACTDIENQNDNLVLPVRNDAAYNEEAAKDLLHTINEELEQLEQQQATDQKQHDNLTPVQKQLETYQSLFGKQWLEEKVQEITHKKTSKEKKEENQREKQANIYEINQLLEKIEFQVEAVIDDKSKSEIHHSFIIDFIANFENHKADKITEKNTSEVSINILNEKIRQTFDAVNKLASDLSKKEDKKESYESQVSESNQLLGKITHQDDKQELSTISLSNLSQLQSQYDANVLSYDALMSKSKLSELKGELRLLSKQIEEKQTDYLTIKTSFTDNDIETEYSHIKNKGKSLPHTKQQRKDQITTHTSTIGGYKLEYKNSQKSLNAFQQSYPDIIALEEPSTLPELENLLQTEEKTKYDIEQNISTQKKLVISVGNKKQRYVSESEKIIIGLKPIPDNLLLTMPETEEQPSVEDIDSERVIDEVSQSLKSKSVISKQQESTKNKVSTYHSKNILPIVQDTERSKLIEAQAIEIRYFSTNQLITRSEQHILTIQDALNAVKNHIQTNKEKLEFINSSFNRLLDEADDALHAAFKVRIPNDMLHYSNKQILKSKLTSKNKLSTTLSIEQRQSLYFDHLTKMIEEQSVDEDGFKLAAAFLLAAYKRVLPAENIKKKTDILKIHIIKPHDVSVEYIPVNMMVGSGGEGLTAGLLLYLVIAKIHGDRVGKGNFGKTGSFLLLDNPFSKANKVDLIRPQTQLAKKLNIQLIFATGIEDLNAIGEFEHVIRLRKDRMDVHSKRQFIEHEEDKGVDSKDIIENFDKYRIESTDHSFNRTSLHQGDSGLNR